MTDSTDVKDCKVEIEKLKESNARLSEIVLKLDKELRIRATNYKKFGHHEVYENTMSLYQKVFGRPL